MSLVHTRTDHPELINCLVSPRNPDRARRMRERFERKPAPVVAPPKLAKPADHSTFYRWCMKTGFKPYRVPFWPKDKKIYGKAKNFNFGEFFSEGTDRKTLKLIMHEVAEKYDLTVNDLKSVCRRRAIVIARHEFYYRARTETPSSYPAIGRFCGGRDHTTIIHGANKHARINGLRMPGGPK